MQSQDYRQIKIGAVLSYFTLAFSIISGFIYTPWMIEQIGKSDYGLYTLANSLITLFLVDFGLSSATSRYISKYRAEGRQDKIDNFMGAIYKLYLLVDAVILVLLVTVFFFLDRIYVNLTPAELEKFKVVYVIAASFAVVNFPFVTQQGILNSYERFIQLKLSDVIYRVLLVALTVIFLIQGYGLFALVTVHAVVGLFMILYKYLIIKKCTPVKVNWKHSDKKRYREIFSFSLWVMVATVAQRLVFNITPSILGVVANTAAVAVFGIVTTIEGYAYTITTAINGMFMPRISRIYEAGNAQSDIMPLMLNVGRFQYALNGLVVVGFFVVGKRFIELWMDPTYAEAYYGILLVLVPGLFFNSLQIANTAMVVERKVNVQAYITVAVGVSNIVLSPILSYFWGVIGACASIFVAYMVRNVAYIAVCQKVMKFDMGLFARKCYLRMSLPVVITIAFGAVMNYLVADEGVLMLLIKGGAVVFVYMVSLWFTALDKAEKHDVMQMIIRKKEQ